MRIQWGADALRFGRRGRRLEVQEHLSLLHAMAFDETTSMISEAISLFSTVEWRGDNSEADEVLDRLVELCTEIFFRAAAVATTPPPLALLPIHRQVARMLAQSGSALALFIETLTGSLLAEVMDTRAAAQAALDDAAKHANGIAGNFELLDRALAVTPGWWAVDDQYDVGRAVWEGVGAAAASVADGAREVKERLGEVPGVTGLDDAQALHLLPAVSLVLHDEVRMVRNATSIRTYVDSADETDPEWVADKRLLVSQIWLGHQKFVEQIVQLGFHLRHDAPRRIAINAALDVYSKLIEGPVRHFSIVAMVAVRAQGRKPVRFEQAVIDAATPGGIINFFRDKNPALWEGASTLFRNSEAHYSYELTEDGVFFRDRDPRRGSIREETLSDDDFIEELSSLTETLAAFEIAFLPYLWEHPSAEIQRALDTLSKDPNERAAAIRAVGGLRGFVEMRFEEVGRDLVLHTSYLGSDASPYIEVLPTLAAIWSAWSTPRVVVHVSDARPASMAFERATYEWRRDENELVRNHKTALQMWDVRVRADPVEGEARRDIDVRFLLLPFFFQTIETAQDLQTTWPDEDIAERLRDYLVWVESRLRAVTVDPELESLRDAVAKSANTLANRMGQWAVARRGRDEHWVHRAYRSFLGAIRGLVTLMDRTQAYMIDDGGAQ